MTTGRINQGASCVRSLARGESDTRPSSVERTSEQLCVVSLLPPACKPVDDTPCKIYIICRLDRVAMYKDHILYLFSFSHNNGAEPLNP